MSIRKRRSDQSGRAPLSSPSQSPVASRDERQRFWAAIAAGMASEDAAVGAGVARRAPSRAGQHHTGGRSPTRAGSVDNLPGVATQLRHPKRRPGVSRNDSAVARRAGRSPPKTGEACAQRGIASLCGGTTGRRRCRSKRGSRSRPRPCPGTAVGMDRGRIGGGNRLESQGRGTLRRDLTACLRSGRVLRMPRARTRGRGKTFISREIMIQPTSGGSNRSRCAGPLGRRPHPRSWQLRCCASLCSTHS
jgi:hypothetical protein